MLKIQISLDKATKTFFKDTLEDIKTNTEILRHNWAEAKKAQQIESLRDNIGDLSQEEKEALIKLLK